MSMRRPRSFHGARARSTLAVLLVASVLAGCTQGGPAAPPTAAPVHEPGSLRVTVLLDLSGPRWPNGAAQRDAIGLWSDQHASGAPRVNLRIVDVAGSDAKTLIELRRAAVEQGADAIVIGAALDYDAVPQAVQLTQRPVLFTQSIPDPATAGGGWAFALAPTPGQIARAVLDDAAARAVLTSAVILSDESASAIRERAALAAELARRGVTPAVMNLGSSDAAAVRQKLASAPVAFFAGTPRPYLDLARGASPGTLLYFSYLCGNADLADLRETSAFAIWPATRWIAVNVAPNAARASFVQGYANRVGPPTSLAASAFDALTLLADASEGSSDPLQLRDRLESRTFPGVATSYSFSATRRAGFATSDLALLRYTGARTMPVLRS